MKGKQEALTLHGVLLAVLPQAHGNENDEDKDHHPQDTAHNQVEHVTAPNRAVGRSCPTSNPVRGIWWRAQVFHGIFGCSRGAFHWVKEETRVRSLNVVFKHEIHYCRV